MLLNSPWYPHCCLPVTGADEEAASTLTRRDSGGSLASSVASSVATGVGQTRTSARFGTSAPSASGGSKLPSTPSRNSGTAAGTAKPADAGTGGGSKVPAAGAGNPGGSVWRATAAAATGTRTNAIRGGTLPSSSVGGPTSTPVGRGAAAKPGARALGSTLPSSASKRVAVESGDVGSAASRAVTAASRDAATAAAATAAASLADAAAADAADGSRAYPALASDTGAGERGGEQGDWARLKAELLDLDDEANDMNPELHGGSGAMRLTGSSSGGGSSGADPIRALLHNTSGGGANAFVGAGLRATVAEATSGAAAAAAADALSRHADGYTSQELLAGVDHNNDLLSLDNADDLQLLPDNLALSGQHAQGAVRAADAAAAVNAALQLSGGGAMLSRRGGDTGLAPDTLGLGDEGLTAGSGSISTGSLPGASSMPPHDTGMGADAQASRVFVLSAEVSAAHPPAQVAEEAAQLSAALASPTSPQQLRRGDVQGASPVVAFLAPAAAGSHPPAERALAAISAESDLDGKPGLMAEDSAQNVPADFAEEAAQLSQVLSSPTATQLVRPAQTAAAAAAAILSTTAALSAAGGVHQDTAAASRSANPNATATGKIAAEAADFAAAFAAAPTGEAARHGPAGKVDPQCARCTLNPSL